MSAQNAWRQAKFTVSLALLANVAMGCHGPQKHGPISPVADGINTRDIIDSEAQNYASQRIDIGQMTQYAERISQQIADKNPSDRPHNVCVLSGGGAYGAYSAGVLCGWTQRGDRPEFDVVTGISTGSLIAPFAFLGPRYDATMEKFYTTLSNKDVYRTKYIRGLFSESLADNAPLAAKVRETITPEMLGEIAAEHQRGRRLYVGTTEMDGKRFIVWDMGAIASRGRPQDRELFCQVLLASSAIPGFFPPQHIRVCVDGETFVERHVDGGVSQSLFFRPPAIPPGRENDPAARSLSGTNVYVILAGKIFADPEVVPDNALAVAGASVSGVIYAQTRGDVVRLYTSCLLNGMNFHLSAIPEEFEAPAASTQFDPKSMRAMFDEGVRQSCQTGWRRLPPGVVPGEMVLERWDTCLTRTQWPTRGATVQPQQPAFGLPGMYQQAPQGIIVPYGPTAK